MKCTNYFSSGHHPWSLSKSGVVIPIPIIVLLLLLLSMEVPAPVNGSPFPLSGPLVKTQMMTCLETCERVKDDCYRKKERDYERVNVKGEPAGQEIYRICNNDFGYCEASCYMRTTTPHHHHHS